MPSKEIMNSDEMSRTLNRIVYQILENMKDTGEVCLVGIRRGGAHLADRLNEIFKSEGKPDIRVGYLDITLYRDDLTSIADYPVLQGTEINFDVIGKHIILVDDVIFTGRTTRAAIDALIDLGRPQKISLAVFIDRGHRELPVQPDFVGKYVPTSRDEIIEVALKEQAGSDYVRIINK
ncbi:Uracil phosphoribosyltransferase [Denitrovibrio acetiphilus DSM 12809]|uniref:Bifunctional protein PyrR n=1 Tax=Denitrovibrio acetiphilus (strain DSM 12809 / NBRC 114555 / N2460) TaxID=522772 RepID=D4H832_DENA2|nr:bifunctional pyr operon transcriptional regulator/uracil phosphoribosyltransferase PyrR [Denitrovibrio acetiphilus]ADD68181.1 Uracil phosphoribosyltransferase [Denitrovibrio acetiphilus DSM 12809]